MGEPSGSLAEWVLIDTETTGLYPPVYTVEVAAQLFRGLVPQGPPFQVIVNPGVPIPSAATAVHGYTDAFVTQNGLRPKEAYERLAAYVNGRKVASHYLPFDWDRVIMPEIVRLGITPFAQRGFCTWALAKRALHEHPTHRLESLRAAYGLAGSRAHTALGDVEATCDLLTRVIFPRMVSAGFPTIQEIAEFSEMRPVVFCHLLAQGMDEHRAWQRVHDLQAEQEATKAEKKKLAAYLEKISTGQLSVSEAIVQHGLIDENASIEFRNRRFLFTGKLALGPRTAAQAAVLAMGGLLAKSKAVTDEVDYLVLGSENWSELEHGGKLAAAIIRRLSGKTRPTIVREETFVAALHTAPA